MFSKSEKSDWKVNEAFELKKARFHLFTKRIPHTTWAWYTLCMSTGGVALLLKQTPHQFNGLETIGTVIFILNLIFFIGISSALIMRFSLDPDALPFSLRHNTEGLFFPTFWLALAVIISGIEAYGVPHCGYWLVVTLRVLFWIYVACTFLVAVFQYYMLFNGSSLTLQNMTPAWLLPVFPVMLTGTIACYVAPIQPAYHAIPIVVGGATMQGLGMMVSIFMYAQYLGRLMTGGLPSPDARPGMFIAVGPPAFTGLAYIGLANAALEIFPNHRIAGVDLLPVAQVLKIIGLFVAICLWSTSFWFFCISLTAVIQTFSKMRFHLSWWSFVFPNTGFIIVTIMIGDALESEPILWVTSGATLVEVMAWVTVGFCHVKAVWNREIMWPGQDEDVVSNPEQDPAAFGLSVQRTISAIV
ncbi:MAG: hypothetical protein M1834_006093 [Cirrosporium novae-zelandiae]|nr:MAG: hypothetical protein M1834_006093 [Cirrosporium novae-zelandiae]